MPAMRKCSSGDGKRASSPIGVATISLCDIRREFGGPGGDHREGYLGSVAQILEHQNLTCLYTR